VTDSGAEPTNGETQPRPTTSDAAGRTRVDGTIAWIFTGATAATVLAGAWPIVLNRPAPPYDPMVLLTGMTVVALIWTGLFAGRAFIAQRAALEYTQAHDREAQSGELSNIRRAISAEIARAVYRAEAILQGFHSTPDRLYTTFRLPSELYLALGARVGALETEELALTVAYYDQIAWLNAVPGVHSMLVSLKREANGRASFVEQQHQQSLETEFERRLREIPVLGKQLCVKLGHPVPEAITGEGTVALRQR
jgi:hypothetical protein